jgi:hypothetical protein
MVRAHATLFVELVDHTDPLHPVVLKRDGVRATLEAGADTRQDYWVVLGRQVRGGYQLAHGDVIYVRTANDQSWWLGEVTAVHGTPALRGYDIHRLWPVPRGDGSSTNGDPRWQHFPSGSETDGQLPLDLDLG